jgi:hypothetical protein
VATTPSSIARDTWGKELKRVTLRSDSFPYDEFFTENGFTLASSSLYSSIFQWSIPSWSHATMRTKGKQTFVTTILLVL